MIITYRCKCSFVLVTVMLCLLSGAVFADGLIGRNICRECRTITEPDARECPECSTSLNFCLDCNLANKVNEDYCENCFAPMAQMRVLSSIPEEQRQELRLGQSKHALIDKELGRIRFLLQKGGHDRESLLFAKGQLLNHKNFHSRESMLWRKFLEEFPDSDNSETARMYLSESLRKWAYLFYQQKNASATIDLLKESVEADSTNTEAFLWLGRVYYENEMSQQAGDAYLNALKTDPGNQNAIHFLRQLKRSVPSNLLKKAKQDGQNGEE